MFTCHMLLSLHVLIKGGWTIGFWGQVGLGSGVSWQGTQTMLVMYIYICYPLNHHIMGINVKLLSSCRTGYYSCLIFKDRYHPL